MRQAFPHATQVADRYHLIQNVRDHLQQFLDRQRTCLPCIEDTPVSSPGDNADGKSTSPVDHPQAGRDSDLSNVIAVERKKVISRNKRLSRYEEVMALHREGQS
jgi:hypothetical protein